MFVHLFVQVFMSVFITVRVSATSGYEIKKFEYFLIFYANFHRSSDYEKFLVSTIT